MDNLTTVISVQEGQLILPGGDRPVLREIEMDVKLGEWLAIVGRNGSGKSMLAKVLAGLLPLTSGKREAASAAGRVQLVMQNPEAQLVGETVYEEVCFGLENLGVSSEEMPARASAALHAVGLQGREGIAVSKLSGGQKQLLAIAGALVLRPAVLIADEITSMLDPDSRKQVLAVLASLRKTGTTVVMITQLLEECSDVDRIMALEDGLVGYDGDVEGFFYEGDKGGEGSVCEKLKLVPPMTVLVAKELMANGVRLRLRPVSPEQLEEAVSL